MKILSLYLFTLAVFFCATAIAQPIDIGTPEIGKPMPDLELKGIRHYKKTKVHISDFRGRWLILDYWARSCVAGIKSLAEVNELQKTFNDQLQFIMVADNSREGYGKDVEGLYERMKRHQDLRLPILYDSVMLQKWGIYMMPHVIIIDPQGIVRYITFGSELNEAKLRSMLAGEQVNFAPKVRDPLKGIKRYAETPQAYSSKISLWNGEEHLFIAMNEYIRSFSKPGFAMKQISLRRLYQVAYTGTWYWLWGDSLYSNIYPRVILELPVGSKVRRWLEDDTMLFNYELAVPDSLRTSGRIMSIMQRELANVFGVEAALEVREMPVWKVIALPGAAALLKAKGDAVGDKYYSEGDGGAGGFSYKNWPLSVTLERIARYMDVLDDPLVDATGITGDVDITIDAMLTDLSQVKRELQKNKLDLVKDKKRMLVLVIKDGAL